MRDGLESRESQNLVAESALNRASIRRISPKSQNLLAESTK